MATKKSKSTTNKIIKTSKKKIAASAVVTKRTLRQRISDLRQERRQRKAEIKRHKQTDEARKVKAENRAIREKALEQVNEAVIKSKRRKSRPALTLFFALVLAGLGGLAAYQYRQIELDDKNIIINELQSDIAGFSEQKAAIDAALQAEEDRFQIVQLDNSATIRVPSEWSLKQTSLPEEEQIIGDENVTLRIVTSESRNSVEQFIPVVDYIWTISSANVGNPIKVESQSLHCERFDTLSNDLTDTKREHKDFIVYCDEDSEQVEIAMLAAPENYGTVASNTYFLVTIQDLQQVDFDDLRDYIESYTR